VHYQSSRKWRTGKTPRKKNTTSVEEKQKDEVKLHAALVHNVTYRAIHEPRTWQGFQRQSELKVFSPPTTRRENQFVSKLKERKKKEKFKEKFKERN